MQIFLIIISIVLLIAFIVVLIFLLRKKTAGAGPKTEGDEKNIRLFSDQLNNLTTQLSSRLDGVEKRMDERLKENVRMIEQTHHGLRESTQLYTERMSKIEEISRQLHEQGRDQARSLTDLTDVLRAPKLRGGLGELLLGDLLEQVFTTDKQYALQYKFKTGDIVDAVVKLRDDTLVPIDAKFSLENFRKFKTATDKQGKKEARSAFATDIKNRIDEISKKYILPDEGTLTFAMMYVPAEGIYYHAFINDITKKNLYQYALDKNVIPVSPNSLYAYLQVIVLGLRGMEIEKSAKEIMNNISHLHKDFDKVSDDFRLVGVHLGRASSSYQQSEKRISRFGDKLEQVRGGMGDQNIIDAGDKQQDKLLKE
ncbi:DNA recombination protein RmuC [Candidatus Woesearchaeota archaeon]|nr:DNA recombination protein RmuC [Candidatus Woesearchaeota archaeon]